MQIMIEDTREIKAVDFSVVKAPDLKKDPNLIYCLGGNTREGRGVQTFWKDKAKMETYRISKLKDVKNG